MFLADFSFSISHLKKALSCSFKYLKSSDVIVVKKKSLPKAYKLLLVLLCSNLF